MYHFPKNVYFIAVKNKTLKFAFYQNHLIIIFLFISLIQVSELIEIGEKRQENQDILGQIVNVINCNQHDGTIIKSE